MPIETDVAGVWGNPTAAKEAYICTLKHVFQSLMIENFSVLKKVNTKPLDETIELPIPIEGHEIYSL